MVMARGSLFARAEPTEKQRRRTHQSQVDVKVDGPWLGRRKVMVSSLFWRRKNFASYYGLGSQVPPLV
jgi:hypothetical protein